MPSASKRPNPLRMDPTRTAALRRKFETELIGRFERLKAKLRKYLLTDDKLELKDLVGNELSNNGWVTIKGHHVLFAGPTGGNVVSGKPVAVSRNKHESAAIDSAHKTAELFGLPQTEVKTYQDPEQGTFGEHGEAVHLMNVHEGKPINKQLNFKADREVTEGEHLAAHEVTHRLYSEDAELGRVAMDKLKNVNAEYGSSVSMYGAVGGAHENLMELGASYSHSPEALKRYSPEMHAIAEEWVTSFKNSRKEVRNNDNRNESFNRGEVLLCGNHKTSSRDSSLCTGNQERLEHLDLWQIRQFSKEGESYTVLRRLVSPQANSTSQTQIANARFKFNARPERIEEFRKWLATQVQDEILGDTNSNEAAWWDKFIAEGYRQGAGRAFDDTKKPYARGYAKAGGGVSDFYKGTKYQFLQSSFAQPETVEKVQLLASRVFTELKGVTDTMSQKITRDLTEGLSRGDNPYTIAKQLASGVDSVGEVRARAIARTEIVRAHNEGQLDALEGLGVEEVGVMVEWSTAMNACKLCTPLEGVTITLKEARGMLPRHVNCRCSWIPANVGESTKGQVRGKQNIEKAIDESVEAELPKTKPRTLEEQKEKTSWQGVDKNITPERPKPVVSPMGSKEPPPPPVKTEVPPTPPVPVAPVAVPVPVSQPTTEKTLKERIADPKLEEMRVEFLGNVTKAQAKKDKLDSLANDKFKEYMELSSRIGNWTQERDKYGEIVYQIVLDDLRKDQAALEEAWNKLNKQSQAVQEDLTIKALKKSIKLPEKHQIDLIHAKPIETTNCEGKAIKTLKQGNVFKGQAKKAKDFIADIVSNDPDKFIWGKIEVQVHQLPDGERAFHRAGSKRISISGVFMDRGDEVHTHIHEIGHRIEVEMAGVKDKAIEFRNMRIAESGSKAIKMSELCPHCNYADHEIGNPDDWAKVFGEHHAAYIGKDYGGHATEVISMGMEMLYKDPVKFAQNDPEYFKFIVGVLRGDI